MIDNRPSAPYATPSSLGVKPDARLQAAFLTHAFVWMFVGLLLTAGVSYAVMSAPNLLQFAANNIFLIIIAQLALVVVISAAINRISATAALGLFFVYAASVGLSIGLIVYQYEQTSVTAAFLSASATFAGAAVYGAVTKRSLASVGAFAFMALIGLLVAMLLNFFLHSTQLSFIISIVGVLIFTALTAWDVQRIQAGDLAARLGSIEKAAVVGALSLYLDLINLFLFFLRLFGGRN
jgi:uncharacterized protein